MANKEINNILLVEGESDIKFFEALIKYISIAIKSIDINKLKIDIINGSDAKKLGFALKSLETDIKSSPLQNLGIVLDLDEYSEDDRIGQVKIVLQEIFGFGKLTEIDKNNFELIVNPQKTVKISCYFIENELVTNLELLLQAIATENPIAATCLQQWYNCSIKAGRKIRKSDYLKFWRDVYIRYDYCSDKNLLKHASENCTLEKSFDNLFIDGKKHAWNFDHVILDSLKKYLTIFIT